MQLKLVKMPAQLADPVQYSLKTPDCQIELNPLIGKQISLKFDGKVECIACGKQQKKLFAQGCCYNCFQNAPESSPCIIHPEQCEGHLGKGRDIDWEQQYHVQPHVVYLAASSAVKVGVTRSTQVPTRWIDQGASSCIKFAEVPYRQLAGEIEVTLKEHLTDKTNWRKMLSNDVENFDLEREKWQLEEFLPSDLINYMSDEDEITSIEYPVQQYPKKVKSVGFDKQPHIEGTLIGIKGQYLLFDDDRVLNIRKHEGYFVDFEFADK